ncbi:MAG: hypothetical protein ACTHMC_22515 [Pseudobacter sp.]|uniref:hypothetical protein n=1 Tax=Pseudobacter sp. TaxID=2045420 RepID=UPI003F7D980D
MMRSLFIAVFTLLCSVLATEAQTVGIQQGNDTAFKVDRIIAGEFTDFNVDNLGNIYVVGLTGQLKKLKPNGDSLAVFNNVRQYGKINFIDVSNPLKVLLHFKDYGTIVILDRFLNARGTLDLRRMQLFQVKSIGQSYDNNIWVYDELESKLKRIGEDGRTIDQSADFRQLFDSTPSPSFIVDQNKLVYLYDPQKGAYIFDYYGTFKNRIRFLDWTDFAVIGNTILGRDANLLYKYEPGTLNLQQYRIPVEMQDAKKIKITQTNIYLLRDRQLEIYSYR